MRRTARWLLAFALGQTVSVVALAVAESITYTYNEMAFVIAACVLVDLAILLGMRLACREAYAEGYEKAVNYEREK